MKNDCYDLNKNNTCACSEANNICPFESIEEAWANCSRYSGPTFKNYFDQGKTQNVKDDPVNHPSHYCAGGIECIDAIAAAISCQKDPMQAWLTGQIIKYLWRWPLKNGIEDLKKARFYLDRLIKNVERI